MESSERMEAPEKKAWQTLHGAWGKRPAKQAQYNAGGITKILLLTGYLAHTGLFSSKSNIQVCPPLIQKKIKNCKNGIFFHLLSLASF